MNENVFFQAKTLGQLTGSIESRYLDTYNGIMALEKDRGTISRLTLRSTVTPGAGGETRRQVRSRDKREETKKPPTKTMSSASLLKVN